MNIKKILTTLLILLLCFLFCSCSNKNEEKIIFESSEDLNGYKLGILTGSVYDACAKEKFPDSEILYFDTLPDSILAVKEGIVDGTINDEARVIDICNENDDITYFSDPIMVLDYAFAFTKNERGFALEKEVSEFIKKCEADGTLDMLIEKWFTNGATEIIPYQELENINGEFTIASETASAPFSFIYNNEITGFDMDFFYRFAKEYGYSYKVDSYNLTGMISAVSTGKADLMGSSIMYTEERAKSLHFSVSYMQGYGNMTIRKENMKSGYNTMLDLKGKTVGTLEGSAAVPYIEAAIEDAQIEYYSTNIDAATALVSGKIAATDVYEVQLKDLFQKYENLKVLSTLYTEHYAFMLPKDKNDKLLNEINEYINKIKADGTLEEIIELWENDDGTTKIDFSGLENNKNTLKVGVTATMGSPFIFISNNEYAGFELDILVRFAKEYGYNLEIEDYVFNSLLAAAKLGKVDVSLASITISEERKENVDFSDSYYSGDVVMVVKNDNVSIDNEVDFFTNLKTKFESTFIKEDRYLLYADGIVSTLLITILSTLFGTVVGVLLFLAFRLNNYIMNKLLSIYSWLITGMPTVVFLMILFYIVFGSSAIPGKAIAIICFTFVFSVSILGLLKTCFASIDVGQFEAAYALGYSKTATFIKIVIPEILPIFLPNYLSLIIELMKSSAVVGYIAVQDVTKAADIIRSRTYDAFFPLIGTTVIYFVIAAIFKLFINIFERKTDPKIRKKISMLDGVEVHD